MYEFKLPDVGEGIHEAEVIQWLVAVGDMVKQDQPVVEIQTDKAVMDLPAPVAGRVEALPIAPGTVARVGEVLIVIRQENKEQSAENKEQKTQNQSADERRTTNDEGKQHATNGQQQIENTISAGNRPSSIVNRHIAGRVLAAPAVRKLALEHGIELADVAGSGPAGRVLPEDVRQFVQNKDQNVENAVGATLVVAQEPKTVATPLLGVETTERVPLQGLRRRVAERMEQAWRVPHVTSFETVEVARLAELKRALAAEAARRGVRLTYTALLVKIAVQALKEHPYFNASLDMERQEIALHQHYHIGIATAIPEGLVVPVVRHADRLSVLQVAAEIERLAERARERRLSQEELSGGTFTITNFGSFGGQQGTPIINPPEAAILGCGRIDEQPVVADGQVVARPVLPLALSFDHRLIDGAAAAQFLGHVRALLHQPDVLLLELV